jgi:7-cyano-7-deazaguanine synthase in queuosine biosynthesis
MNTFYVVDTPPCPNDGIALVPGRNLVTGLAELQRRLGVQLTTLEADLLTLAAAVYASDLAAQREERESFVRDLRIEIPLVNHHLFAQLSDRIADLLYLVSSDNWTISVSPKQGVQEQPISWPAPAGATLLFSGGLDSLAASIEFLEDNPDCELMLASHYTRNQAIQRSQGTLFEYLGQRFGPRVQRVALRVGGQTSGDLSFPGDADREPTQRARSFLFLVIGAIVARRTGCHKIFTMAENGQLAIHLPLTAARLGSFSTRTAHPEFLYEMERLLSTILSIHLSITNPFVYRTKAECIGRLIASHSQVIQASVSCWRSSRQAIPHCGQCVPCLLRRIAVESHGLQLAEYQHDLFSQNVAALPETDDGKRNLVDIAEFVLWFGGARTNAQLQNEFQDITNVHIDATRAIDMYRRFAREALSVFSNYPGVQAIL